MNWFVAKLVFHLRTKQHSENTQFEESHRLIQASSAAEAFHIARSMGASEDSTFLNAHGHHTHWHFVDVADVRSLDSLESGTEVFSQVAEYCHSELHLSLVKQQAHFALQKHIIFS